MNDTRWTNEWISGSSSFCTMWGRDHAWSIINWCSCFTQLTQLEIGKPFTISPFSSTESHTSDCSVHFIFLPNPVRDVEKSQTTILKIFLCCQLPGGKNSPQSFVGPRQTPLWKRSSGTIWLEEEYVHCSAQLRIIYHNGSTWCSERGLAERELEHHKWSILANKAGENSNISLSISLCSPSHLSLLWYQLFLPSPPLSTCLHLLMLICCFSDTHHWGSHF